MTASSLSRTVYSHRDELCQLVRPYVVKEYWPFVEKVIWTAADKLANKLEAEQARRSQEFMEAVRSSYEAVQHAEYSAGVAEEAVASLLYRAKEME